MRGAILLVFAARGVRTLRERQRGMFTVSYPHRQVRVPEGLERAGSEPALQHSACQRLRRPRPLFDLPRARGQRPGRPCRGPRAARPSCWRASAPAPTPPIRLACQLRPHSDVAVIPILPPQYRRRLCARPSTPAYRRRALRRQHVRRHARLDQAVRDAAAVRHRLPDQPIRRSGIERHHRGRRPAEPVRRRWCARAVRARYRSGDRLQAGAARRLSGCLECRHT